MAEICKDFLASGAEARFDLLTGSAIRMSPGEVVDSLAKDLGEAGADIAVAQRQGEEITSCGLHYDCEALRLANTAPALIKAHGVQ